MKQMFRMMMIILLVGGLAGLSACSEDDKPGNNNPLADVGPDSGEPDTTPDDAGDGGNEDEPDTCTPSITECSADMCGEVDNGCGEMLDCGACPCDNGVVSEESCGTCGLGVRTCGSDETGFGTCTAPELPGVAEDADEATCSSSLIFVDAGAGAGGDGSKEAPFATYADAATAASSGQVIILGGASAFQEPLNVKKGVSVIGGFSASPDFTWSESSQARFEVAAPSGAAVFGLMAREIDQATTVANVEVTTGDAEAGFTNYGAYVVDSPELTMTRTIVRAGKGGAGEDGTNGSPGANGTAGADARGFKGTGAAAGTNDACPEANGGRGGIGSRKIVTLVDAPQAGEDSDAGAVGGSAGTGGFTSSDKAGGDGADGTAAAQGGQDGDSGMSGGRVENELWVPEGVGGDGAQGSHGQGGAGGGGAWYGETYGSTEVHYDGPEGAGGGAGGCGGEGGTGGTSGAGSFGLFLVRSDVSLVASEFYASAGGVGGDGGLGGRGGNGASGGAGTSDSRTGMNINGQSYTTTLGWSSGDGGDGADGREGGDGGGGAGGVSYGAYCVQSRPQTEDNTKFVEGPSSFGGQSSGNAGQDGIAEESYDCD